MEPIDDLISVGRISKPHGIKGEIELFVLTDYPERFKPDSIFILSPPTDELMTVTIESIKSKKKVLILKFKEISDRDAANRLKGVDLSIKETDLMSLPGESYWHFDLIGLRVITVDGIELGEIKEILEGQGHDIFIVKNGKEYMIPAVKKIIKEIKIDQGQIVISPPQGLL